MTAFDKKINQIATRHRWNIEKQARAAVPCYIIAAPTYEDAGKIVAVLNRCKGLHHETLTPIHYESWAVKVYDAGQIAAYRERERQKAALVDFSGYDGPLDENGFPVGLPNEIIEYMKQQGEPLSVPKIIVKKNDQKRE